MASNTAWLADVARYVIQRNLHPRFASLVASYAVASNTAWHTVPVTHPTHFEPYQQRQNLVAKDLGQLGDHAGEQRRVLHGRRRGFGVWCEAGAECGGRPRVRRKGGGRAFVEKGMQTFDANPKPINCADPVFDPPPDLRR